MQLNDETLRMEQGWMEKAELKKQFEEEMGLKQEQSGW